MTTKIEWCDETINPIQDVIKGKSGRGYHCTKISSGCDHCYADGINNRFGNHLPFDGRKAEFEIVQSELEKPLKWKKPQLIFVQSMGDLFHNDVPQKIVAGIIMMIAGYDKDAIVGQLNNWPVHQFIILTKRPSRMRDFFLTFKFPSGKSLSETVLTNLWIGVTAENQEQADKRIPILLQIPAAVRLVSVEPILGPVDLNKLECLIDKRRFKYTIGRYLDWVICGGESGPGARPMHPDWVRSLRDQCQAVGVPFFFKQWGEWVPCGMVEDETAYQQHMLNGTIMNRIGKKSAGRLLDGKTWDEYPKTII